MALFPAAPLVGEANGKPIGLFPELISYFAGKLDWKVQYVRGTWSESLERLDRGEIDLMPAISFTPERARKYQFSKNAIYIDSGVLFSNPRFALHTIHDLQGKQVAALRGSIFTTAFEDYVSSFGVHCEMVLTDDNEAVMRAIAEGSVDAGVCIYSLGNELAKSYPVAITPISFGPMELEFSALRGRNTDLIEGIDRLMEGMVGNPNSFYSLAYRKWALPAAATAIPRWLLWGIGGLVLCGLILLARTVLLRTRVRQRTVHLEAEIAEHRKSQECLTQSLREKETLLKELHHRTKNTMHVVRSIVSLQALDYPENQEVQILAKDTVERIQAIALVHEMLYSSGDLSRISIKEFIERLARLLFRGYGNEDGRISLSLDIADIPVLLDTAMPLGIVLNELLTNSIKHAFPEGRRGRISIRLEEKAPGLISLDLDDNGIGAPLDMDLHKPGSFGLSLIHGLVEGQLMGKIAMESRDGLHWSLEIPTDLYTARV